MLPTNKSRALQQPYLQKLAGGREISGLNAYE